MRPIAVRRRRTVITRMTEIVDAMSHRFGLDAVTDCLRQHGSLWHDVIQSPVPGGTRWCVQVFHDDHKAQCLRRSAGPFQRRGKVRAVTRVAGGDLFTISESGAAQPNAMSHSSHVTVQGSHSTAVERSHRIQGVTMEFFEAISARQSIRAYQATDVEHIKLERILTAANTAPSAGNLQAYQIVVVQHAATRSSLAVAAHGQGFLAQAPVVLVFFADPARSAARYAARGERLFCIQDATIAACHAQLAATALGLGSCWVGAFDDRRVAQILCDRHSCTPCVCWRSDMPRNAGVHLAQGSHGSGA